MVSWCWQWFAADETTIRNRSSTICLQSHRIRVCTVAYGGYLHRCTDGMALIANHKRWNKHRILHQQGGERSCNRRPSCLSKSVRLWSASKLDHISRHRFVSTNYLLSTYSIAIVTYASRRWSLCIDILILWWLQRVLNRSETKEYLL